jgi:hypothetical protein
MTDLEHEQVAAWKSHTAYMLSDVEFGRWLKVLQHLNRMTMEALLRLEETAKANAEDKVGQ